MVELEQDLLWQEVASLSQQLLDVLEQAAHCTMDSSEAQGFEVALQQLLLRRGEALFKLYTVLFSETNESDEKYRKLLASVEQMNQKLGSKLYERQSLCLEALRKVMTQHLNLNAYKQRELEAYMPIALKAGSFR